MCAASGETVKRVVFCLVVSEVAVVPVSATRPATVGRSEVHLRQGGRGRGRQPPKENIRLVLLLAAAVVVVVDMVVGCFLLIFLRLLLLVVCCYCCCCCCC